MQSPFRFGAWKVPPHQAHCVWKAKPPAGQRTLGKQLFTGLGLVMQCRTGEPGNLKELQVFPSIQLPHRASSLPNHNLILLPPRIFLTVPEKFTQTGLTSSSFIVYKVVS